MKEKDNRNSKEKENLNSILRLRLFYSTEQELSKKIGYNLKGNHFSRFKDFQSRAYFSMFAEICKGYTNGKCDLAVLLHQYDLTSKFYKKYIEGTVHKTNKSFIPYLLDDIYLGKIAEDGTKRTKETILCKQYNAFNKNKDLNIGILILMTYGLIPTFKNKRAQDIPDIKSDYKKAHEILLKYTQSKQADTYKYTEMQQLKEMRDLIEEEQAEDKYINRLLLIHITNDVLSFFYALKKPAKLKEICDNIVPMDFIIPRLWRSENEHPNVVWEFVSLNNCYNLFRKEIDFNEKKIRLTRCQIFFRNIEESCFTVILHPSYFWNLLLKKELPKDSYQTDYTDVEYENEEKTVKKFTFKQYSPIGEKPLILETVNKNFNYYATYLDHINQARDFKDVDTQSQYHVEFEKIEVAVMDNAILFNTGVGIYKMNKYDGKGNETISGISSLTHKDNFVIATLIDKGKEKEFLCLDSISQYLDVEELLGKPFFREIECIDDLF